MTGSREQVGARAVLRRRAGCLLRDVGAEVGRGRRSRPSLLGVGGIAWNLEEVRGGRHSPSQSAVPFQEVSSAVPGSRCFSPSAKLIMERRRSCPSRGLGEAALCVARSRRTQFSSHMPKASRVEFRNAASSRGSSQARLGPPSRCTSRVCDTQPLALEVARVAKPTPPPNRPPSVDGRRKRGPFSEWTPTGEELVGTHDDRS